MPVYHRLNTVFLCFCKTYCYLHYLLPLMWLLTLQFSCRYLSCTKVPPSRRAWCIPFGKRRNHQGTAANKEVEAAACQKGGDTQTARRRKKPWSANSSGPFRTTGGSTGIHSDI